MFATYTRNLVAEGYTVTAKRSRLFIFLVIKPCGTVYEVDPVANTCTCRAGELGKHCCHRTQLQSLLRSESRRLLALSAEVEATDPTQGLMLVAEVEDMVAQWKDVQEFRPFRSFEQAESLRSKVYAPSSRFIATSIRPVRQVAAIAA